MLKKKIYKNTICNNFSKTNSYYNNFFYKYFNCKLNITKYKLRYKFSIFMFFKKYYIPYNINYKFMFLHKIFLLYLKNSWNTYRFEFGFSFFKKTRTNSKSQKNNPNILRSFLFKYIFYKKFKKLKGKLKHIAMHMEFLNKLWFFQWNFEWRNAIRNIFSFRYKTKLKRLKLGVYYSKKNKALNFIPKPLKKNKKKVFIPQDNFNVGFFFHFSNYFFDKIIAGNSVK